MADPKFVYLKLNLGKSYTLNVGGKNVTFTEADPAPDVQIPTALVRGLGLHREKVQTFDAEGEPKGQVARFQVSATPFPRPKPAVPVGADDLFAHSDPDAALSALSQSGDETPLEPDPDAQPPEAPTGDDGAAPATKPGRPRAGARNT